MKIVAWMKRSVIRGWRMNACIRHPRHDAFAFVWHPPGHPWPVVPFCPSSARALRLASPVTHPWIPLRFIQATLFTLLKNQLACDMPTGAPVRVVRQSRIVAYQRLHPPTKARRIRLRLAPVRPSAVGRSVLPEQCPGSPLSVDRHSPPDSAALHPGYVVHVVEKFAGMRSAHGRACSSCAAIPNRVASSA